jgi:hypothetical protein
VARPKEVPVTILTASRASGSSGSPKGSPSNDPYCVPRFRKQCAERGRSPVTILTVPPSFEERCPPKERSPVRILTVPRVSRRRAPPKEEVPSNDPDCAQRFEDERPNGSGGCGENAYVNPGEKAKPKPARSEAKRSEARRVGGAGAMSARRQSSVPVSGPRPRGARWGWERGNENRRRAGIYLAPLVAPTLGVAIRRWFASSRSRAGEARLLRRASSRSGTSRHVATRNAHVSARAPLLRQHVDRFDRLHFDG